MELKTKDQFREAFRRGVLGNKLRTWDTFDELLKSGYHGLISIRDKVANSSNTSYGVPVYRALQFLKKKGQSPFGYYFNESAPDDHLILQGELWQRSFMYSTAKQPMKIAMRTPSYSEGLATEMLLRATLNDNSYDDLQELRLNYPESCFEFSVYSHCLGNLEHRNTVIWEVRNY